MIALARFWFSDFAAIVGISRSLYNNPKRMTTLSHFSLLPLPWVETDMYPQDLLELLRIKPFIPFRLYATDGRTYDVKHPDQALVLSLRVILPISAGNSIPERSEHLALSHIIRAEELPVPAAHAKGNGTPNNP